MTRGIFATGACVLASLIVACSSGDASSPAEARTNTGANAAANESAPSDTHTKSDPSAASVSGDGGADETTDAGSADGAASQGLGVACTKSEDCPSGFCTDGVCCNEACTTECRSCNQPGKMGTCSDVPLFGSDTARRRALQQPDGLPELGAHLLARPLQVIAEHCENESSQRDSSEPTTCCAIGW